MSVIPPHYIFYFVPPWSAKNCLESADSDSSEFKNLNEKYISISHETSVLNNVD